MNDWACDRPGCGMVNLASSAYCAECGARRPAHTAASPTGSAPGRCPHDDRPLMANGWCEYGEGFPMMRTCPFVCDRCRSTLTWGGTCLKCDAYAPGNRYEYTDTNPHWQLVEKGPFVILPPAEQIARAKAFKALVEALVATMTPSHMPTTPDHDGEPVLDPAERMARAQRMLAEFTLHNAKREAP